VLGFVSHLACPVDLPVLESLGAPAEAYPTGPWMQTILLQDDPDLFRGLEHSLLCREGIALLTAAADADLLERCRQSRAQVVLLAGHGDPATERLVRRLESLPHDPLCLVAAGGGAARELLKDVESRLGLAGRAATRRVCRVAARVAGAGAACKGRTRDISISGTFVATEKILSAQTPVVVEFTIPGVRPHRRHAGVVVRSQAADPHSHHLAGMAVQFAPDERLSAGQLAALPPAATVAAPS